jgi:hypothetical protein
MTRSDHPAFLQAAMPQPPPARRSRCTRTHVEPLGTRQQLAKLAALRVQRQQAVAQLQAQRTPPLHLFKERLRLMRLAGK